MHLQGGFQSTAARYISFHAARKSPLLLPRYCVQTAECALVQIGTADATYSADDYCAYRLSRPLTGIVLMP
jgi:hypothetical protein